MIVVYFLLSCGWVRPCDSQPRPLFSDSLSVLAPDWPPSTDLGQHLPSLLLDSSLSKHSQAPPTPKTLSIDHAPPSSYSSIFLLFTQPSVLKEELRYCPIIFQCLNQCVTLPLCDPPRPRLYVVCFEVQDCNGKNYSIYFI